MGMIMEKATFSEIYKLVEGRGGKIKECFDGLFDTALLFFPAFMCKETAGIIGLVDKLGAGQTLIGAKETITKAVSGILDGFKHKEKDYAARYENMQIAHMLIIYAAFFDAAKEFLPDEEGQVVLSAKEKYVITKQAMRTYLEDLGQHTEEKEGVWFLNSEIYFPEPTAGFREFLEGLKEFYERLTIEFGRFYEKLAVWDKLEEEIKDKAMAVLRNLPERAMESYEKQYYELECCFEDFAVWAGRERHKKLEEKLDVGFEGIKRTMLDLEENRKSEHVETVMDNLLKQYSDFVDAPVIDREEIKYENEEEPVFPAKRKAFIPQSFQAVLYKGEGQLEKPEFWTNVLPKEHIGEYISSILRHPCTDEKPVVILGQPGAGKSLLCYMLAAQILCHEYHVIIVRLRDTVADDTIIGQIEQQIRRDTGRRCEWDDICNVKTRKPFLIIFDGYDELLQASGRTYANYMNEIAKFQRNERVMKRMPVKCMMTSRITLIDKAHFPKGSLVLRLCDFEKERIQAWCDIWNRANQVNFAKKEMEPFSLPEEEEIYKLAGQPLLLLMLALYDFDGNKLKKQRILSATELYDNLIKEFVVRELKKEKNFRDLEEKKRKFQVEEEVRKIGIAAIGMFNRKKLYIGALELGRDLSFYYPDSKKGDAELMDARLTQGETLLGSFFFIHKSNAVNMDRGRLVNDTTYEFLHNTFGEFLVADFIVKTVCKAVRRIACMKRMGEEIGWRDTLSAQWYAPLIYAPLFTRPVVVDMISEWGRRVLRDEGISDIEIQEVVDEILGQEMPKIIDGNLVYMLGEMIKEKENPYECEGVLESLGIYSANLLILCCLLNGKEICFSIKNRTGEEIVRRLNCMWEYSFHEKMFDLSGVFSISEKEREVQAACMVDFFGWRTKMSWLGKLSKMHIVSQALGQTEIDVLTSTVLGNWMFRTTMKKKVEKSHLSVYSWYICTCMWREDKWKSSGGALECLEELAEIFDKEKDTKSILFACYMISGNLEEYLREENVWVNLDKISDLLEEILWMLHHSRVGEKFQIAECILKIGTKKIERGNEKEITNVFQDLAKYIYMTEDFWPFKECMRLLGISREMLRAVDDMEEKKQRIVIRENLGVSAISIMIGAMARQEKEPDEQFWDWSFEVGFLLAKLDKTVAARMILGTLCKYLLNERNSRLSVVQVTYLLHTCVCLERQLEFVSKGEPRETVTAVKNIFTDRTKRDSLSVLAKTSMQAVGELIFMANEGVFEKTWINHGLKSEIEELLEKHRDNLPVCVIKEVVRCSQIYNFPEIEKNAKNIWEK